MRHWPHCLIVFRLRISGYKIPVPYRLTIWVRCHRSFQPNLASSTAIALLQSCRLKTAVTCRFVAALLEVYGHWSAMMRSSGRRVILSQMRPHSSKSPLSICGICHWYPLSATFCSQQYCRRCLKRNRCSFFYGAFCGPSYIIAGGDGCHSAYAGWRISAGSRAVQ
jgi:hypothetical protein